MEHAMVASKEHRHTDESALFLENSPGVDHAPLAAKPLCSPLPFGGAA